MSNPKKVKLDFKRLAHQAAGLARTVLPAALTGTAFALVYKFMSGEPLQAWLSGLLSAWLVLGCLPLAKQPPASIRESGRLLARAAIWPWYLFHDSTVSSSDKLGKLRASFLVLLFFAGWEFIDKAPASSQLTPLVRDFVSLIQSIGVLAITGWVARSIVVLESPMQNIAGFIWRIALLELGIAGICYLASDVASLLQWVQGNPSSMLTVLVAVAIVWFLFSFAPHSQGPLIAREYAYGNTISARSAITEPTERDNRVTSAHEAGHAIIYAALGFLPNEVKVVMDHRSEHGGFGYVSSVEWMHLLTSRAFSEWKMLVFLGGQAAEEILLGETTLGANSDMTRWQVEAKAYLSNGFGTTYFNPPENQLEAGQNQAALDALRGDQRALLQQFFGANKQVLKDLATTVADKRELGKSDLIPFLARVQFIAGFPKPNGEFTDFNPE